MMQMSGRNLPLCFQDKAYFYIESDIIYGIFGKKTENIEIVSTFKTRLQECQIFLLSVNFF